MPQCWNWTSLGAEGVVWCIGVPYELTPEFLEELLARHRIDYVVHGDDPCLLPDGSDAYAHVKQQGRFRMVRPAASALLVVASSCLLCAGSSPAEAC